VNLLPSPLSSLSLSRFTVGWFLNMLADVPKEYGRREACCAERSSRSTTRFTVGHTFRTSSVLDFLPVMRVSQGLFPRVLTTLPTTRFTVGRWERCDIPGSGFERFRPVLSLFLIYSWRFWASVGFSPFWQFCPNLLILAA